MKRYFFLISILFFGSVLFAQAQSQDGFQFTTVKENPITPIKNQASSGTCWSFAGLALVESDLLRDGKGTYDLSEMFIVHKNYQDKAKKYVRMHGETNFGPGGSFADVFDAIRDYGIVPETELPGLNYGEKTHQHSEMDALLEAYTSTIVKRKNLTTAWFEGYKGIIDSYLGGCPEKFTYNGKEYTPQTFAQSLGIVAEDYVSITSFTHHPFYSTFPIEVQDNWRWALSYNLPMEEMMEVVHNAINNRYSVAWASDVSEKGFSRNGIAVIPDFEAPEGPGSDQAHWLGLSPAEREKAITDAGKPVKELTITQEMRQKAFDNYQTTDDHGMLIYGTAKDQNGTIYFLVKNSWGDKNKYKGTWYASEAFVKYKTTNIVVHKNALSKELKQKLNIK